MNNNEQYANSGAEPVITTKTFDSGGAGLEQSYTIPQSAKSLGFKMSADVELRMTTGTSGDSWPLESSLPEAWNDIEQMRGAELFFTGLQGETLTIREFPEGT